MDFLKSLFSYKFFSLLAGYVKKSIRGLLVRKLLSTIFIFLFLLTGYTNAYKMFEDDLKAYIESVTTSIIHGLPIPIPVDTGIVGAVQSADRFSKQNVSLWLNRMIRDLRTRKRTVRGNEYYEVSDKLAVYQAFSSCLKGNCADLKQIEGQAGANIVIWVGGSWECPNHVELQLGQTGTKVFSGNMQGSMEGNTIHLTGSSFPMTYIPGVYSYGFTTSMIATISRDGERLELKAPYDTSTGTMSRSTLNCRTTSVGRTDCSTGWTCNRKTYRSRF